MFGNMRDWIRRRFFPRASRPQRRRQAAQSRHRLRLQLEGLEDRITPSGGLPYATAANASQLSQDFAYANANPTVAVVVNLQPGAAFNLADTGSQLLDQSTAGIILNGNGDTITAATNNRIIEVDQGAKLTLNNVTITGGNLNTANAQGGGIGDFGGDVTLSAVNVTQNAVHGGSAAQGGGIYVSGSGTLTLQNGCLIDNNQAVGSTSSGGAANASGGGIYVAGSGGVTITSSSVSNNFAQGGGNTDNRWGGSAHAAWGGGLDFGGNTLNITNSDLSNNVAQGGNAVGTQGWNGNYGWGAAGGVGAGGGLSVFGGAWNVTITASTLNNNSAQGGVGGTGATTYYGGYGPGGNGGSVQGGGIYVNGSGVGFTIQSSSFSGNTAQGGDGGPGGVNGPFGYGSNANGGAVAYSVGGYAPPLTIVDSSFDTNSALGGNGSIGSKGQAAFGYSSGSTFSGMGGSGGAGSGGGSASGGGLYTMQGHLDLTNSSVTNNTALGGSGGSGGAGGPAGSMGYGGAGGPGGGGGNAYGGGLEVAWVDGGLTLINTTVGGNTAQGGAGGAGGVGGSGGLAQGSAGSSGRGGNAYGGGLYGYYGDPNDYAALTLLNDTVAFNGAVAGSGGQTAATAQGGGIYDLGSPTLTNVILQSNSAATGPDFYGAVGTASGYDFIDNTGGITNSTALSSMPGMILNNQTPQLDTLTFDPTTGLSYYPLLANSQVIGAGTQSVVNTIAAAEGVPVIAAADEIHNQRVVNNVIAMGAAAFPAAPAPDVYDWSPLNRNDLLASHPQNWIKNGRQQNANGTLPGNKATDQVVLATNANITWDQNFSFSSMLLGQVGAYTGQQTINPGVTVELTGAQGDGALIIQVTDSALNLNFGTDSHFQIDADSTITNMRLGGDPSGVLDLHGGWTRIAQGNYQDYIGVPIIISHGATLSDLGSCPLTFTNNDLDIAVYGAMNVYYGTGAGSTLINQDTLINGCYVYVSGGYEGGGILTYTGYQGKKDTFAVPVAVEFGGTFAVTSASSSGGTLIVKGAVPATQNVSVYMSDVGSSVQLSSGTTLECDNHYLQVGGVLETMDTTDCTLQDDPNGQGTAIISGGGLKIAANGGFGLLTVKCDALDFSGTYSPAVLGGSPTCDGLVVTGTMNILAGSYLQVTVVGTLLPGNFYSIISTSGGNNIARFSGNNDNVTGLTELPDQPFVGDYMLKKF